MGYESKQRILKRRKSNGLETIKSSTSAAFKGVQLKMYFEISIYTHQNGKEQLNK